jgi:hypothetical protein
MRLADAVRKLTRLSALFGLVINGFGQPDLV